MRKIKYPMADRLMVLRATYIMIDPVTQITEYVILHAIYSSHARNIM